MKLYNQQMAIMACKSEFDILGSFKVHFKTEKSLFL